jgi:alpha-L-fucosidase
MTDGTGHEMGDASGSGTGATSAAPWAGRPVPTWFRDAKLGIFVHWTVGSVPAFAPVGVDPFTLAREHGERMAFSHTPYAEWYWNSVNIPGSPAAEHHERVHGNCDYEVFVRRFLDAAEGWEPTRWRDLFAASGARYAVMVTKHHDGVLLWPSEHPNPFRGAAWQSERDLVGEVADATRAAGLRFGAYYSGGIDWTFQGLGIDGWRALFAAIPQSDEYLAYADTHWRELMHRYRPDVLWNDIGYPRFGEGAAPLLADFYAANPEGVVNDRFDVLGVRAGRTHADFTTPEYSTTPDDTARPFEVCRGIGTSFGYVETEGEHSYLPVDELLQMFVGIVADGGNLLLNIGPMPGGEVPWGQQLRLLALGQWLSTNGAAVYGSRPHEVSTLATGEGIPVRLTAGADGASYAFVLGRPDGATVTIDGLPAGDVHLLGHGSRLARRGDTVVLPARPDDTPVWTLRVAYDN